MWLCTLIYSYVVAVFIMALHARASDLYTCNIADFYYLATLRMYVVIHIFTLLFAFCKKLFQFARLGHFLTLLWAAVLAVYWLITSALLANLYERYCDRRLEDVGSECGDNDEKFVVLPIFGFVCMGAWVS